MDYSYLGSGKVYMRVVDAAAPLRFIGNVTDLTFNVAEDNKELKDRTQPGGGTYNEVRRIGSVEATVKMSDLSPDNVALAMYGTAAEITAGATSETHTAYVGGLVRTNFPIDTTVAVTVSAAGSPDTPYTLDDDFTVRGGGIEITDDSAITDGQSITIGYTKKAGNKVEALVAAAQEYELLFDGLNEARSGKTVRVTAHRVKFGPAQALALLSEEYAELEVRGKLLKDTSKNGTSESQYFVTEVVA